MAADYDVVYGGHGSGKSTHSASIIDTQRSFKLGVGSRLLMFLILRFNTINRHEQDNRRMNLRFKSTNIKNIVKDIEKVREPVLLIDDWTTFFLYTFFWSAEEIITKANEIFTAIDNNPNIKRVVFICLNHIQFLPLSLYKKKALWNKLVFKRAKTITKIEFGIPVVIKK